jgi:hypothetical protein
MSKERGSSDQLACGTIPYRGNADFSVLPIPAVTTRKGHFRATHPCGATEERAIWIFVDY